MRRYLQVVFALAFLAGAFGATDLAFGATCTGSSSCRACSDCSSCKHCAQGGSCGVCSSGAPRAYNPVDISPSRPQQDRTSISPRPAVPAKTSDQIEYEFMQKQLEQQQSTTVSPDKDSARPTVSALPPVIGTRQTTRTNEESPVKKAVIIKSIESDGTLISTKGEFISLAGVVIPTSGVEQVAALNSLRRFKSQYLVCELESDSDGPTLNAYLFSEDGKSINAEIISRGLVLLDSEKAFRRKTEFETLQASAKSQKLGVWSGE